MTGSEAARGAARISLAPATARRMREHLPSVAEQTIAAVVAEVPSYAQAFGGEMGVNIERAVQMALGGFVRLVEQARPADPGIPLRPAVDAAYQLGRGEAREERSMDALLAAYRVGARVAWRELSGVLVEAGLPAATVAQFAELVFAYIDELSAASVAGHADERATTGRVREQYLEQLGQGLLAGASPASLAEAAERAGWAVPATLTAVLVPEAQLRPSLAVLDAATLRVPAELADADGSAVLLVPDAGGPQRPRLLAALAGRTAVVGPARPWSGVASSFGRARRARAALAPDHRAAVDTEAHLAALVIGADPEALADLRERMLAPLAGLRPSVAERLAETLRSWLLHQGRRDDVAADCHVHPQTVRYRMTQVRELYGDRLKDPDVVRDLMLALEGRPVTT